jgi:hypothetical protein
MPDGPMPPVVMHCRALIDQRNAASLPAIRAADSGGASPCQGILDDMERMPAQGPGSAGHGAASPAKSHANSTQLDDGRSD